MTNLARPGGNITGFHNFDTAIAGKWLGVLKEIAPAVRRVAVTARSGDHPECRIRARGPIRLRFAWDDGGRAPGFAAPPTLSGCSRSFASEPDGGVIVIFRVHSLRPGAA